MTINSHCSLVNSAHVGVIQSTYVNLDMAVKTEGRVPVSWLLCMLNHLGDDNDQPAWPSPRSTTTASACQSTRYLMFVSIDRVDGIVELNVLLFNPSAVRPEIPLSVDGMEPKNALLPIRKSLRRDNEFSTLKNHHGK